LIIITVIIERATTLFSFIWGSLIKGVIGTEKVPRCVLGRIRAEKGSKFVEMIVSALFLDTVGWKKFILGLKSLKF